MIAFQKFTKPFVLSLLGLLSLCGLKGTYAQAPSATPPVSAPIKPPTVTSSQSATQTRSPADAASPEFNVNARLAGNSPAPSAVRYIDRRRATRRSRPRKGQVYLKLGITFGRARLATDVESKDPEIAKIRDCLESKDEKCILWRDLVVERIDDTSTLTPGTLMQIMVEYLAHEKPDGTKTIDDQIGYLYVINRVEYADKQKAPSTPKLIYPGPNYNLGDNRVLPGKTLFVPGPLDLWLVSTNKNGVQAYEVYYFIISPKPLVDSRGRDLQGPRVPQEPELDEKMVQKWLRSGGGDVISADLEGGLRRLFSTREQAAGYNPRDTNRDTGARITDLKKDDPSPQMGFRRAVGPGGTMLVTIKLPYNNAPETAPAKP